jgi:hypothetical protein
MTYMCSEVKETGQSPTLPLKTALEEKERKKKKMK